LGLPEGTAKPFNWDSLKVQRNPLIGPSLSVYRVSELHVPWQHLFTFLTTSKL